MALHEFDSYINTPEQMINEKFLLGLFSDPKDKVEFRLEPVAEFEEVKDAYDFVENKIKEVGAVDGLGIHIDGSTGKTVVTKKFNG